ncbi:NXN [Symbiodinium sp. CCMP2456]|nr:NXN [Symbiodinium sp. CCMP2456]
MSLVELLGSSLLANGCAKDTSEALKNAKAVALYFSAHWCPPCRGFTPKLAEWYKKDLQAKGLEVVFVSADRSEEEFKEYFAEMPWLALDFSQKDVSQKLNKKFKVNGIPMLVVVDPSGQLITADGRQAIAMDPEGKNFPWIPPKPSDLLQKMKLKSASHAADGVGHMSLNEAMQGKKALALYFSAHWCPPCRGFTPKLAEWYKKDLSAKGLEVVFVSSDRDQSQFDEYFKEMPWLALDFADRDLKEQLSQTFKVDGIPSLVVLDANLEVVTLKGRDAVSEDPEGHSLPWYPKPVQNLAAGPGDIEDVPTVVVFCESSSKPEQQEVEDALTAVSSKFIEHQKAAKESSPEVAFMIATKDSELTGHLRSLLSLTNGDAGKPSMSMVLIDIPSDGISTSTAVPDLAVLHRIALYRARIEVLQGLEDPEKVLDQALDEMQGDLIKVRQSYAEVLATQRRLQTQKEQADKMAEDWYKRAEMAVEKGDDELAKEALTRRQTSVTKANDLGAQIDAMTGNVEKLFESVKALEAKITQAKEEKEQLIARARTAKTTAQVNEMLSDVTSVGSTGAFDRMKEKVEMLETRAEVSQGLLPEAQASGSLEDRFKQLEAGSAVDDELAKMKGKKALTENSAIDDELAAMRKKLQDTH